MTKLEIAENFFFPIGVGLLLVFCGLSYLLRKQWAAKKIQAPYPSLKMILRDTALSLTAPIFYFPGLIVCYYCSSANVGFVYHKTLQYGVGYFILSIFLVTLVHDTYYYWMHRLLHTKWLFKKIHITHHLSKNPTVMTFFAMHPLESFIMPLSIPLCIFLFPLCDVAFDVAYAIYTLQTIYGHSGFCFSRKREATTWLASSYGHNLHHSVVNCNYSYFYNVWDRCCGTLLTAYPLEKSGVVLKTSESLISSELSS